MAAGDGFDEQTFVNSMTSRVATWESRAVDFFNTLRELAGSEITLDLPDSFGSLFISSGLQGQMQNEIDTKPSKPTSIRFVAPASPGDVPSFSIPATETVQIPTLNETAPNVTVPSAPELDDLIAPTTPVLRSVTTPSAPTVVLPDTPLITNVVFPEEEVIQLPTFTQSFPVEPDLLIPKNTFDFAEEIVATPTLDKVQAKVESDLDNGGFGIEPEDEDALYDRVRDRELQAAISEEENELRDAATRGFQIPPGVAAARIDAARQAARERISEANREISTTRAELFRRTRESTLNLGIQVEAERLRYHGFRLERALNAQRFAAEFSINVFDAEVRKFNARLEAYNSFVRSYGARIQAELAKVEIFKTRVQAAVEQQRAKQIEIELYSAVVNAAQTRVQLFESQVRAAALEVDVERTKMESFRAEVQAYASRVESQQVEMNLFEAVVRAEQAKVDIYSSQVDAFRNRVQAAQIENDVRNQDVERSINVARLDLSAYEQDVRRFTSSVAAEDARVRGLLGEYSGDTDVYRAALAAWEGLSRVGVQESNIFMKILDDRIRQEQVNADLDLKAQAEELQNRFNASNAGVNVTREIITALQGSINALSGKVTS